MSVKSGDYFDVTIFGDYVPILKIEFLVDFSARLSGAPWFHGTTRCKFTPTAPNRPKGHLTKIPFQSPLLSNNYRFYILFLERPSENKK